MSRRFVIIIFSIIFGHNLVQNTESDIDVKQIESEINVGTSNVWNGYNESNSDDPGNCTTPAITNFPYISSNFRKSILMSVLAIFAILYLFIGTALICDEYFVPSL